MWNSIFFGLVILVVKGVEARTMNDYLKARKELISEENSSFFGANLKLNGNEIVANECLMNAKFKDIDEASTNLSTFWPSRNFLDVRNNIEQSELFKMIRLIPKGAVLHTHGASTASLDFLYENLTNIPNLYVCFFNTTMRFRFFETPGADCDWKLIEKLRESDPKIISKLRQHVTLPTRQSTPGYNSDLTWKKFREMFDILEGLLTYRPAFEIYLQRSLQELYDDNIFYMEFRGPFYKLYELNGTILEPVMTVKVFKRIVDKFVAEHPGFIGAKLIHTSNRQFSHEEFKQEIKTYKEIKRAFPNLMVGFDISNHEDKGHPDLYFMENLLEVSNETSFYFHAGETNWFGHTVDENLFDAVLLNSKRIGHGFALLKHPKLMEIVKEQNIAIEVNPISNQVLGYVADLRNHPAAYYFAKNFSVVISNDNPSFWGSWGLSYDFYEAFVGIMSRNADLRALKQLIINSIEYSAMTNEEKKMAYQIWENSWLEFVKHLVYEYQCQEKLKFPQVFNTIQALSIDS